VTASRGNLRAMDEIAFEAVTDPIAAFAGKPGIVRFLDLPPVRAVAADGEGPVGPAAFEPLMPGLYGTAYTLRFALKRRGVDVKVGPLEACYSMADGTTDLDLIMGEDRGAWRWTLFIALPAAAEAAELEAALAAGRAKMTETDAPRLRVAEVCEGRVAQLLHVGPYAAERPNIERLHAAIAAAGLVPRDRHHEIYLGDPSRSAPERLRTILRQPVAAAT
jgi:hypothetical protein